jgi:hypothetical protein
VPLLDALEAFWHRVHGTTPPPVSSSVYVPPAPKPVVLPAPEPVLPEDGAFVDGDGVVRFRDPQTDEVIDYAPVPFLATLPCDVLSAYLTAGC